jgi:hypothetical protein
MDKELKRKWLKVLDKVEEDWRAPGVHFKNGAFYDKYGASMIRGSRYCPICILVKSRCRSCLFGFGFHIRYSLFTDYDNYGGCMDIITKAENQKSRRPIFDAIRKARKWVKE